jgi:hypothetical protein
MAREVEVATVPPLELSTRVRRLGAPRRICSCRSRSMDACPMEPWERSADCPRWCRTRSPERRCDGRDSAPWGRPPPKAAYRPQPSLATAAHRLAARTAARGMSSRTSNGVSCTLYTRRSDLGFARAVYTVVPGHINAGPNLNSLRTRRGSAIRRQHPACQSAGRRCSASPARRAPLLGSGTSLWLVRIIRDRGFTATRLARSEWPWLACAIAAGGIFGPILLMYALTQASAADASLGS